MAKPISPTPILTGHDAQAVIQQLECGTPMTPERKAFLKQAQANFKRHQAAFAREGIASAR